MAIGNYLEFNLSVQCDIGLNDHAAIKAVKTPIPAPVSLVLNTLSKSIMLVPNRIVTIWAILSWTSQTSVVVVPNTPGAPSELTHTASVTMMAAFRPLEII